MNQIEKFGVFKEDARDENKIRDLLYLKIYRRLKIGYPAMRKTIDKAANYTKLGKG